MVLEVDTESGSYLWMLVGVLPLKKNETGCA